MSVCLLTGASGFIGSALSRHLQDQGHRVIGAGRLRPGSWSGADWRSLDLAARHWEPGLLDGVEHVFHCAAIAHTRGVDETLMQRVNHEAVIRLAGLARQQGVSSLIFISSILAAWPEQNTYARAKRQAEDGLRELANKGSLRIATLRPALVYGPGVGGNLAWMMHAIAGAYLPPLPELGQRPMISRQDLLGACQRAAFEAAPQAQPLVLCDGEHYSVRRIARVLTEARGRRYPDWQLPAPAWRALGNLGSLLQGLGLGRKIPDRHAIERLFTSMSLPAPPDNGFQWQPHERLEDVAAAMWTAWREGKTSHA